MRRAAIRAVIALYPRRWRLRYGPELQELAIELDDHGALSFGRVVMNLLITAATLHADAVVRHRVLAPLTAALAFAVLIVVVTVIRTDLMPAEKPVTEPHVLFLGQRIVRLGFGKEVITLTLNPKNGAVSSVTGAPASLLLNPNTGQLIGVTRRHG
jgi:hypothetical protein